MSTTTSASEAAGSKPTVFDDGLAQILGLTPLTLAKKRCTDPGSLPPHCLPPGSKRPIYIVEDVLAWLRQYQVTPFQGKRRGRPTKAEQIARREAQAAAREGAGK